LQEEIFFCKLKEILLVAYTKSHFSANFVGIVVGFLNVCKIRLRSLLLAAALSFECNSVLKVVAFLIRQGDLHNNGSLKKLDSQEDSGRCVA
jgi:hypothetical protein